MSTPWLSASAVFLVIIAVVLLALFRRHKKTVEGPGKTEAERALLEAQRALAFQRDMWHPILEVAEEARALRARNHFAERLAHAYSAHPGPPPFNRRRDDPK